jgi:hypothetical protein
VKAPMHGTMPGGKRDAMLQEPTLKDFFDWLLDCENIPEPRGTPQRFLPRLDKEIQRLKKLEEDGCPGISPAIENLGKARSVIAQTGYEFRSERMSAQSKVNKNWEEVTRLFVATCVAAELFPGDSPHQVVWDKLNTNGYVSGQNIDNRAIETRVRRFEKAAILIEHLCLAVRYEYGVFWSSYHWPELRPMGPQEIEMLEKLCANIKARKDKASRAVARPASKKASVIKRGKNLR